MGKKINPKSIDSMKLMSGILIWILSTFGGFLLWMNPPQLPIPPIAVTFVASLAEIGVLMLFSLLLQKDRNGGVSIGGIFAFAALAYPLSVLCGMLIKPGNVILYLIPVLWFCASAPIGKAILMTLLALLPETFEWLNIHYTLFRPIPPLPGKADPLLFDWTTLFTNYFGTIWIVPVLALMIPRLKSTRVSTGFKSNVAAPSKAAKKDVFLAPSDSASAEVSPSLIPPSGGTGGAVQVADITELQNSEHNAELRGILESIVFFMSKNFKAHSALGLLSLDEGHTFVINAKYSKSNYIKDSVLVYPGSGLVGKAITEPSGFMTGSAKTYPDKVEYYTRLEEVNSIVVSRIVDTDSRKVLGLLVVDSPSIRAFDDADKDLLNRFSVVASQLISSTRMRKILEVNNKRNEIVSNISKLLVKEKYTRGVLAVLMEHLRKVFDADRLVVCAASNEEGKAKIIRLAGDPGDLQENMLFQIDDPYCLYGTVFLTKIEYLETEISRENRYRFFKGENPQFEPAEVMVAPLMDDHGNVIAVIGLETNRSGSFQKSTIVLLQTIMAAASSAVTRAQLFTKIEKQATMDGLTKIANHRHFQDTLDVAIAKHTQARKPFALLLMDIDHFKKFNDTYGHPIGDKVLQSVAAAVTHAIRPNDFVARYGGEEFTVILDLEPALVLQAAERIREAIESQELEHEGQVLKVTVSIGAAVFPTDGQVKKDLIELADQAMYRSKKNGRNQVTQWSQVVNA